MTDEQRGRRPIFNATLRAVAGWLFFLRRGGSLRINLDTLVARALKNSQLIRRPPDDITVICEAVHQMDEQQARFEELFLPHLDAAYSLARLLVKRDQDAQDVVQDAYIRALKGFKRFRGGNPRAWILIIVRNTAYSWLKKRPSATDTIPFNEAIHHPPAEESPSEGSYEERVRQLNEALARLSVEYREILVLRDIEGWSYKQLASALNLPSGTVMSRLSRARERLREEIAKGQHKESQNEV